MKSTLVTHGKNVILLRRDCQPKKISAKGATGDDGRRKGGGGGEK